MLEFNFVPSPVPICKGNYKDLKLPNSYLLRMRSLFVGLYLVCKQLTGLTKVDNFLFFFDALTQNNSNSGKCTISYMPLFESKIRREKQKDTLRYIEQK